MMSNSEIKLEDVLSLFNSNDVDKFIKKYTGYDLSEKLLKEEDISKNWKFLGGNSSNLSSVGILANGENGIIERVTNAIDAVIEKQKEKNSIFNPKNAGDVIKKSFPVFYQKYISAKKGNEKQIKVEDANDQVILAVNDSSKTNCPTFDIVDKGIGVEGENFITTLLSLSGGNKLSSEKRYLIGAFGQGGSTSLPFAHSTIIISKKNNKIFFTIIKRVFLKNYKTPSYMYLTLNEKIPELIKNNVFIYYKNLGLTNQFEEYIVNFINSESGTLVRMIETDISKNLISSESTKPSMLVDYVNTKLFGTIVPIKIIENRKRFQDNANIQNRYSYGLEVKLKTWKRNVLKNYMGTIEMAFNNKTFKVDYYVILPSDENKWGSDSECKSVFKSFNNLLDPIIYTINGQTINTESYTKLKNVGLTFLKYRLLIVINLDYFENEKYNFITSSRSQLIDTALTRKLLDEILKKISLTPDIIKINEIIAQKTIDNSSLDEEELKEFATEVKNTYAEMLKTGDISSYYSQAKNTAHFDKSSEELFSETIESIKITSKQNKFYLDEEMKFILETGAKKSVNQNAQIFAYIDEEGYREFSPSFMNSRIAYISQGKAKLPLGNHKIYFMFFPKDNSFLKTADFDFELLNEISPNKLLKIQNKSLDLDIKLVKEEAELISNVSINEITKKITVLINLENQNLKEEIYKRLPNKSSDKMNQVKKDIIKPIALFTLLLKDIYETQSTDWKNKIVVSHVKTIMFYSKTK